MAEVKKSRRYSSSVRDEQAARTRARILEAAGELFVEQGYARTTVQGVADRVLRTERSPDAKRRRSHLAQVAVPQPVRQRREERGPAVMASGARRSRSGGTSPVSC